jgi:hypothetical protein
LYLLIKPYFIPIFLQNIYTPIVYDKKEQNYSTSIISLENSESTLPASKSQSNSESHSPNEIIKGRTFSNKRFHINFAQSSEISSSQYLQKCWQISGVNFKIGSSHKLTTLSRRSYKTPVPFQLGRCWNFVQPPLQHPLCRRGGDINPGRQNDSRSTQDSRQDTSQYKHFLVLYYSINC